MATSKPQQSDLLQTGLAACRTLTGGALGSLLAGFIANVGTMGWEGALAALAAATTTASVSAVLFAASLFGLSEASQGTAERKKATDLLAQIDKLGRKQDSALYLINQIADGDIGVTLDEFTKQDLVESIVTAMRAAGLTPTLPKDNFAEAKVRKNHDFVGRRKILDELHARLEKGDVALTHDLAGAGAQALRGEGGIGKTQIAVEYARKHEGDYEGRWWLDASTAGIAASTASLATTLGHPPGPQDTPEVICETIRRALSGRKHLLILDNLDDPRSLDALLLPPPARVLITTRLRTLPSAQVSELPVSILEPDEAVELLCKHRKDLAGDEHYEALCRIGEHLGCHSLAVAVAASYLWKRKTLSPAAMLDRLQQADVGDEAHLLEKMDPAEHTAGYRLGVAQSLSLHLPDFADTPAMALLLLAALCHPDKIPVDVFLETLKLPQEEVEDWLVKLDDVSIVHYDGETISLHRLMQEVVRARMDAEAIRAALGALVGFLCTRFEDPDDHRNWAMQDDYAAHAEAALERAERATNIPKAGLLGNQLGLYVRNRARFDAALSVLHTAERIDRAKYGNDHPEVATAVNNIGSVFYAQSDLDGALNCFREAERIDRAEYGDDHPNVAVRVNNIGSVLNAQGHLDGALKCYREAERIARAAYGDDHPVVASYVNNIGGVLQNKGDLDGALECFREAERIDRAVYGDNHPEVAIDVNNIGGVLKELDDLDGALKRFREAERIDRAAYGDHHPRVATDVNNIGAVLLARGDVEGARAKVSEAFGIFLSTTGPRALDTIQGAKNLMGLGVDPIALAREIVGDEAARQLEEALGEQPGGG